MGRGTRIALGGAALGLIAFAAYASAGCTAVLGVDFGAAHLRAEDAGAPFDVPDAQAVPTGTCAPGDKVCNAGCVSLTDPAFGCGNTSCERCSVPFGAELECRAGACAAKTCQQGHGDCDQNPANGCETDLTTVEQCGACGKKCNPGEVCAPTGCAVTCPQGLTNCGGSCVDLNTSPAHCNACGNACPVPANGDPGCINGACRPVCRTGFSDCDNNPANGCEPLTVWYADTDKDGFGDPAVTKQACTQPAGYVAAAGDCSDAEPRAFPGQTSYFPTSFPKAGVPSFDFNCNGVEERNPGTQLFMGCSVCNLSGYIPASPSRSGAGVDAYCGSTNVNYCFMVSTCQVGTTNTASGFPCR